MRAHRYTYAWLIYDMYNMVMDFGFNIDFEYVITLDYLQTCFINGFWKGTNHAGFKVAFILKR